MNALTKLVDYIKSRCTKNDKGKPTESSDDNSEQTPRVSNTKKRPQMEISPKSKEQPLKRPKLTKTSAKKLTIIDLTQGTEEEGTTTEHTLKKKPALKMSFHLDPW